MSQWTTSRRNVAFILISVLLLGVIGVGAYASYGSFRLPDGDSEGYIEVQNFGNQSVNVSFVLVDVRTGDRLFRSNFTLSEDGKESHYSVDWPSTTSGKQRLTVVVNGNRSDSLDFNADNDGAGRNLMVAITEDEIGFGFESGGM
jgi:hypothetical protein